VPQNEPLTAKKRKAIGTKACRRVRNDGQVPAVIYGHGEDPVSIQVPAEDLHRALRRRARMFDVKVGRKKESVLLRDLQYDAFGDVILHADFVRVAMDEAKGQPDVDDAVLQQTLDTLEVECLPADIPEEIVVPVGHLQVNESLTVADLEVPEAVTALTDPETVVATVTPVQEEAAEEVEEVAAASGEEPEVIGRAEGEEEGEAAEGGAGAE